MTNSKKDSELEEIIGTFISLKFDVDTDDFSDGTLERWNNMLQAIKSKYITKEESDRRVLEARIEELDAIAKGQDLDVESRKYVIHWTYFRDRIAELRELLKGDTQ